MSKRTAIDILKQVYLDGIADGGTGDGMDSTTSQALKHLTTDLEELSEIFPERGIGSIGPVRAVRLDRIKKYLEGENE